MIVVDLKYFIGTSFLSVQKLTSKLAHNESADYILIVLHKTTLLQRKSIS